MQSAFFCFSVAQSCPSLCDPMDCSDVLEQYEVSRAQGSLCWSHLHANDLWCVVLGVGALAAPPGSICMAAPWHQHLFPGILQQEKILAFGAEGW